jgi:hypothetical protein
MERRKQSFIVAVDDQFTNKNQHSLTLNNKSKIES